MLQTANQTAIPSCPIRSGQSIQLLSLYQQENAIEQLTLESPRRFLTGIFKARSRAQRMGVWGSAATLESLYKNSTHGAVIIDTQVSDQGHQSTIVIHKWRLPSVKR